VRICPAAPARVEWPGLADSLTQWWIWDAAAAVGGACIGSFLGVVADRVPEGLSVVAPGSFCRRCGHPLAWYDNIPLVGYFSTGARCRHCGGRFSAGHMGIEIFTAMATFLFWRRIGPSWELLSALFLVWALIAVSVIDIREQIIPDVISIPGTAAGLAFSFLPGGPEPWDALAAAALGGGLLWLVAWAYWKLRGREGMGLGDAKLLAMIGAFLGLQRTLFALMAGSVIGVLISAPYLLIRRRGRDEHIPFGPFLAAGAALSLAAGPAILEAWRQGLAQWVLR